MLSDKVFKQEFNIEKDIQLKVKLLYTYVWLFQCLIVSKEGYLLSLLLMMIIIFLGMQTIHLIPHVAQLWTNYTMTVTP